MKKFRLEDIEKRQVFNKPPDGYFDKLPAIIQSKTSGVKSTRRVYWVTLLKLAPAAALLVLIVFYSGLLKDQEVVPQFEQILAEVSNEDIIWYLEELDLTNDEILEAVDVTALSMDINDLRDPLLEPLDIEDEALIELFDDMDLKDSLL